MDIPQDVGAYISKLDQRLEHLLNKEKSGTLSSEQGRELARIRAQSQKANSGLPLSR